jgi:hypothetical protein
MLFLAELSKKRVIDRIYHYLQSSGRTSTHSNLMLITLQCSSKVTVDSIDTLPIKTLIQPRPKDNTQETFIRVSSNLRKSFQKTDKYTMPCLLSQQCESIGKHFFWLLSSSRLSGRFHDGRTVLRNSFKPRMADYFSRRQK